MDLKPGISAWYGVKMPCTSFHVCESFGVVPMSHMWDDCDEPDCSMCESECSQVPEYEWFGSYWAMDPPMERCMMYKPGRDFKYHTRKSVVACVVSFLIKYFKPPQGRHQNGEYGYYWLKGVCTEKYGAICEIDFKHQACHAFGMDDVSSMKWITNESYNSTHLEYQFCDSGSKVGFIIYHNYFL